jgi:hypothetical protein
VAKDEVYLIDWEAVKTGDYLEDLAFLRVMFDHRNLHHNLSGFWKEKRNIQAANNFLAGMIEDYERAFEDDTIRMRLKVYLTIYCLHWLKINHIDRHKFGVTKRTKHLLEDLQWFWSEGFDS